MEEKKTQNLDFAKMLKDSKEIKERLAKAEKESTTSVKPLKFEKLDGDSALKLAIVERINEKNLTYSDLYNYCAKTKNGDMEAGKKAASNLINGLRTRHTMIDTTFSLLCDFLGYDIYLSPREEDKEDEE